MAVLIAFHTVAVIIAELIATVCIFSARRTRYTKAPAAYAGFTVTGGHTFDALSFAQITKATRTVIIAGAGGTFNAGIGVGVTDQAVTTIAVDQAADAFVGVHIATARATVGIPLASGFGGVFCLFAGTTGGESQPECESTVKSGLRELFQKHELLLNSIPKTKPVYREM